MKVEKYSWIVDSAGDKCRLDLWLSQRKPPLLSRSAWQRLIKNAHVLVNGKTAAPSAKLRPADKVTASLPPPEKSDIVAEEIPLDLLFEDQDILVINKPPAMVVHPAAGNRKHTLVNALLHYCASQLSGIGGVERPGLVHRLDADTSGCLVVAKNDQSHQSLAAQFEKRTVKKIYLAWVWGEPRRLSGRLESPIGRHPVNRKKMAVVERGKPAVTEWKLLEKHGIVSLLECRILTGRTHQIRVHLSHMGHPIVGDKLYGRPRVFPGVEPPKRQMLHSWKLSFDHPRTGEKLRAEAPLPADFLDFKARIKKAGK